MQSSESPSCVTSTSQMVIQTRHLHGFERTEGFWMACHHNAARTFPLRSDLTNVSNAMGFYFKRHDKNIWSSSRPVTSDALLLTSLDLFSHLIPLKTLVLRGPSKLLIFINLHEQL